MSDQDVTMVREAVGVFDTEDALQAAVDDLLSHGFDRAEISLLAATDSVERALGHAYRKVSEIEDDSLAPRIAYVAEEDVGAAEGAVIGGLIYVGALAGLVPVVASGGALAAALAGMAVGGGGGAALGAVLARLIGKEHGDYVSDQIAHGGLALWVRTWNAGDERRAVQILKTHSGKDVHLHGIPDHAYAPIQPIMSVGAETSSSADIVSEEGGVFYAAGKMFTDRETAEAYLERQNFLDRLYQAGRSLDVDLDAALLDPADAFKTVHQLMSSRCEDSLKLELLRRWEYDIKALEVADDEGMTGSSEAALMQDIELSIRQLERV